MQIKIGDRVQLNFYPFVYEVTGLDESNNTAFIVDVNIPNVEFTTKLQNLKKL